MKAGSVVCLEIRALGRGLEVYNMRYMRVIIFQ
jgi:hypothetical protein